MDAANDRLLAWHLRNALESGSGDALLPLIERYIPYAMEGTIGFLAPRRERHADCVIRCKSAAGSDASRPVIPTQSSHPFRGKPAIPDRG